MTAAKNLCLKRNERLKYGKREFKFKRKDASQMQVLCKSCRNTVVNVTSRGNATNLHSHLEQKHMELFEDFRKCKAISTKTANEKPSNNKGAVQTTIDQSFTNATFYGKTSKRHKELTDAVNVKDMMAVNTVSKEGFVGLINKLDRRYQLPSRNYFSHVAIPQMYDTYHWALWATPFTFLLKTLN